MSEKKLPFYFSSLRGFVLYIEGVWLLFYSLKKNYNLILCVNDVYSKLSLISLSKFNKFILKALSTHWLRISFRGKGFRLRKFKKTNKMTLNFGHSHWAKLAFVNNIFFLKKIRRQNYICVVKGYGVYKTFKKNIKFFKKLNSYTKRGLRLKKQYIQKRFGKISQVVSSLH